MQPFEELLTIADSMGTLPEFDALEDAEEALDTLESTVAKVARAFSGSWQGYHANVYYEDLKSPPPGAHFSQE